MCISIFDKGYRLEKMKIIRGSTSRCKLYVIKSSFDRTLEGNIFKYVTLGRISGLLAVLLAS